MPDLTYPIIFRIIKHSAPPAAYCIVLLTCAVLPLIPLQFVVRLDQLITTIIEKTRRTNRLRRTLLKCELRCSDLHNGSVAWYVTTWA